MAKIISPKWRITAADIPSVYRSALISIGGMILAVVVLLAAEWVFPEQDFSQYRGILAAGVGAWVVNTARIFFTERTEK